jgi:DNA-binding NtrC family response regulator
VRVLIVDSNTVFAKQVGKFLHDNLKQVEVEYASNVPILLRRLRHNNFDFIIVDIISAFDSEALIRELEHVKTPKLVWAVMDSHREVLSAICNERILNKPNSEEGIEAMASKISSLMFPAVVPSK